MLFEEKQHSGIFLCCFGRKTAYLSDHMLIWKKDDMAKCGLGRKQHDKKYRQKLPLQTVLNYEAVRRLHKTTVAIQHSEGWK